MNAGAQVVIPARGGSTRIPGKNLLPFNGAPMIQWPIRAALEAQCVDVVMVSTDSEEIARVGSDCGAEVPFVRPTELANDTAGTAPVILHALAEQKVPDEQLVMCLYPTAPITSSMIDQAISLARKHPDDMVISVGRHRSPLERSLVAAEGGKMTLENLSALFSRTQDLPQRYFDAGKFYVATAKIWRERETMMAKPFIPMILPDWASVDMDEPDDWAVAEALHRAFVLNAS
jgi:N-acylneuraminate cytidylyltransferase